MRTAVHWVESAVLLGAVAGIGLVGFFAPDDVRVAAWLVNLALMGAFTMVAGHRVTGHWAGALIDERNKVSLSRLQLLLWTAILLSAYLTTFLANVRDNRPNPQDIDVPEELWVLMGISITSMVGSPLLRSGKLNQNPEPRETLRTLEILTRRGEVVPARDAEGNAAPPSVDVRGVIVVNETPARAQWTDIFKGEETGNAATLDAGKVQMFSFTLVLALTYGVLLGDLLDTAETPIRALPAFDEGMLALLGISHAGYLTNKAVPHSRVQD